MWYCKEWLYIIQVFGRCPIWRWHVYVQIKGQIVVDWWHSELILWFCNYSAYCHVYMQFLINNNISGIIWKPEYSWWIFWKQKLHILMNNLRYSAGKLDSDCLQLIYVNFWHYLTLASQNMLPDYYRIHSVYYKYSEVFSSDNVLLFAVKSKNKLKKTVYWGGRVGWQWSQRVAFPHHRAMAVRWKSCLVQSL